MSSLVHISMYIEAVYILRKLVQARRCGALDLLVERARGRGPEPARHGVEARPVGGWFADYQRYRSVSGC